MSRSTSNRGRVVDAAVVAFGSRGYDATSLDDLTNPWNSDNAERLIRCRAKTELYLHVIRNFEMAQAKLIRVPGKWAMRQILRLLWKQRISAIPPEALPYMTGEYIMNTDRLRRFLGPEYEHVIRYSIRDAFADSFRTVAT